MRGALGLWMNESAKERPSPGQSCGGEVWGIPVASLVKIIPHASLWFSGKAGVPQSRGGKWKGCFPYLSHVK